MKPLEYARSTTHGDARRARLIIAIVLIAMLMLIAASPVLMPFFLERLFPENFGPTP